MSNQIENYSKEDILNPQLIKGWLTVDEEGNSLATSVKLRNLSDLKECARKLKCVKEFNQLVEKCNNELYPPSVIKNPTIDETYNYIIQNYYIKVYKESIYIYIDNNKYTNDIRKLHQVVYGYFPNATIKFIKEVQNKIKTFIEEEKEGINQNIIAFKNGLLDLNTMELFPSSPEYFFVNIIPHDYNPKRIENRQIEQYLNEISCNNNQRRQAILEMIGYSMTSRVNKEKAFILYGYKASNGKSTFLELLELIVGEENTSHTTLKDFSNNKSSFALSGLENKLLNVEHEVTNQYLKDLSKLKAFITGNSFDIEKKYEDRRKIKPYSKYVIGANELPTSADITEGFYRRFQIILFEAQYSDTQKQNFKFENISNEEAIEYLINISLKAYKKIEDTKIFSNDNESEEQMNIYRNERDSIYQFLIDDEEVRYIKDFKKCTITNLYKEYVEFCKANNYIPFSKGNFIKSLEKKTQLIRVYKSSSYNQKCFELL